MTVNRCASSACTGSPYRRIVADAVDQQEGWPGPGDPEGTAVAVDGAELQ